MLKELYEEVQGIVYKCRNEYYLHLWELSDWDQEGMICLHELISREEELVEDIPRLRKYFKTKFRNRILDYIRKQESQKRRYDKEPYEEVGEISHRISEGGLWLDDYYLFHETLRDYRSKQSKDKQEELERVLRNERFRGRQRVLRDLRNVFKEFDIRTHYEVMQKNKKSLKKAVDKKQKVGIIVRVENNNNSGPLVKGLRHRLFTAVTRVRIPYGLWYVADGTLDEKSFKKLKKVSKKC